MGHIISLQGGKYEYEIPLSEPDDEKEIINYDKPISEQVWRIPPMPDLRHLKASEKGEFIERERRRWLEGVYILINGELTYLTGMHYDHLVYQTFDFGKAEYLDNQRLDFYFRDLTRRDQSCFGRVWIKPRRYGMTAEEITEALYTSMEDFSIGVGLQSNETNKTKQTLLHPLIDSIYHRPKFMRPRIYTQNGKKPRGALEFKDPKIDDGMMEEDLIFVQGGDEWLGGHVYAYPTLPAALDGTKKKYIVMDEVWKWVKTSPKETLKINLKTLRDRRWGIGKISMLSTMGDSDDYLNAVKEGIKIINESDPDVRDDNGYTTSKLYEYFVSAIYSHDLPNFYDKYGKIDAGRAEEYIMNDRKNLVEGTKDYFFELRRMPLVKSEALISAVGQKIYDSTRITLRLQQLNKLPPNKKPYVRGKLIEDSYGRVSFEADPDGLWLVAIQPFWSEQRNIDTRNRFKRRGQDFIKPINPEGAIGYDPVRYAETTSDNVSRAAIIVGQKFDYFGSGNANKYCALWVGRTDDPEEPHEEAFKAARYWGYPIMYERQVESVLRRAKELHMLDFILKAPDGKHGLWTDNNRKVKKQGVDMIQGRIKKPAEGSGEPDRLMQIPFEDWLYDADEFDIVNSTPFDVHMASIELEHGLLQILETNVHDTDIDNKIISSTMYPKRNEPSFI